MFRLRSIVPRNTQNTQKFSSARKFCEFCGSTFQQEASVCSVNSVGRCNGSLVGAVLAWLVHLRQVHPLRGCVGMAGCHTLLQLHRLGGCPKISVRICDICGSTFQQEASVCSVNSVGKCSGSLVGALETSAPPGTAPPGRQRGYGRMPYPPISAPLEEISSLTC